MRTKTFFLAWLIVVLALGVVPVSPAQTNLEGATFTSTQPWPESGPWFDPSDPGSGFFWEVQNGTLVGAYFGFDKDGNDV